MQSEHTLTTKIRRHLAVAVVCALVIQSALGMARNAPTLRAQADDMPTLPGSSATQAADPADDPIPPLGTADELGKAYDSENGPKTGTDTTERRPTDYIPSESISEDRSVSFPVDI